MLAASGAGCSAPSRRAPGTDAEIQVQLPRGVPVYLTYTTAQVRDGKITYLPDTYGWDKQAPVLASIAR